MPKVMTRFKKSAFNFITGRVGIYRSFFIISPVLLVGMYVYRLVTDYLWALRPVPPIEGFVKPSFDLFILLLIPIIATAGVVGSVFRAIVSKKVGIIHKILGLLFFLIVLLFWLVYLSLFEMVSYN